MHRKAARLGLLLCLVCPVVLSMQPGRGESGNPPPVDFDRDIRPILSENCFTCHGPDERQRYANLRLDTREGIFADRGGYQVVVPEDPEGSRLMQRLGAESPAQRMPPPGSGKELTADQVHLLRSWIEEGAEWRQHWAFSPPRRPELPRIQASHRVRNAIDMFILERLAKEGLEPSPEADRTTLIRRVTLDLTGLPPTPREVDAFLADSSPHAYQRLLDRLLASPRYGERMAWRWLEAARYADTNGYQSDGERYMWRWRDWVIGAFNQNMPFDQFTIEQIAGDMLPGATLDQKIATGFNRNHSGNGEGGVIPAEYAVEYVVDRVDTTSTVWLGLTMGCARCHDHKYDPITQKEFYQLFAFFNNVPEKGDANKHGNSPPMIKAPTAEQQIELRALEHRLEAARNRFSDLNSQIASAQVEWETSLPGDQSLEWTITRGLVARYRLDGKLDAELSEESENSEDPVEPEDSEAPTPRFAEGEAVFVPGRLGEAGAFDGARFIEAGEVGGFGYFDKFSLGAWVYLTGSEGGTVLSKMEDTDESRGYSLEVREGKVYLTLAVRRLDDALRVQTAEPLVPGQWHHLLATYDGSRVASGITVYVDGHDRKLEVLLDDLNQSFTSEEPLRIGARGGAEKRFHGYIDDVRVYSVELEPDEAATLVTFQSVNEIAGRASSERTEKQATKLRLCFLESYSPPPIRRAWQDLLRSQERRDEFFEQIPTTMVMAERETPRDTFFLNRGEYDKPGEKVTPNVPSVLPPLPSSPKNDRLALARWLVDPANPLTARVTVNRIWQMYFGAGLVKTPEDFGTRGELPTHPRLLDWLATELISTGWDLKALHKTILMSTTYRQASRVTPSLQKIDPANRWLARGPRLRLSAEMIRDQALFSSGLLVEQLGGPSVRPYQPEGLWKELSDFSGYTQDSGESLYRRSLYTFWKRTIPPPSMGTFDAATRETCTVRETRTNTPLQALTLLNDITFVEAARVLAQRMMREGGAAAADRIDLGFRLATARRPNSREREILLDGLEYHLSDSRKDPDAALDLTGIGEIPRDDELEVTELAAYTAVANLILNLDETVTKE